MGKNARGYVQDSCTALNQAKDCLENALKTVERDSNRERIQQSLQAVEDVLTQCDQTADILKSV